MDAAWLGSSKEAARHLPVALENNVDDWKCVILSHMLKHSGEECMEQVSVHVLASLLAAGAGPGGLVR